MTERAQQALSTKQKLTELEQLKLENRLLSNFVADITSFTERHAKFYKGTAGWGFQEVLDFIEKREP